MILYWISGLWIIGLIHSLWCRYNRKDYEEVKWYFENGYPNWKVNPTMDKYWKRYQKELKVSTWTT